MVFDQKTCELKNCCVIESLAFVASSSYSVLVPEVQQEISDFSWLWRLPGTEDPSKEKGVKK
jgi:hypothetical protein